MRIGGRFGFDDDGQTPITQITISDYGYVPIIHEVRGLSRKECYSNMDIYFSVSTSGVVMRSGRSSPSPNTGVVVHCEYGYVNLTELIAFNNDGKEKIILIVQLRAASHFYQCCT